MKLVVHVGFVPICNMDTSGDLGWQAGIGAGSCLPHSYLHACGELPLFLVMLSGKTPILLGIQKLEGLSLLGLNWEGIFLAELLYWIRIILTKQGPGPWVPISLQSLPLLLSFFLHLPRNTWEAIWREGLLQPCLYSKICCPAKWEKYSCQKSGYMLLLTVED